MKVYDFAILGGGAAGLSLALALARSSLVDHTILIVEKEAKNTNDRTWCFWTHQASPYDNIRFAHWDEVRFVSEGVEKHIPLQPYRYQMLRGIDFYNHARQQLANLPNVEMVQAAVEEVIEEVGAVQFWAGEQCYRANWVFDSRFDPQKFQIDPTRYLTIKQHFEGWKIETDEAFFNPCKATLFDLRTEQRGGLCFYYILPFDERHALVEYTVFSCDLLPEEEYQKAIQDYLDRRLGQDRYRVLHKETGVIPMTDYSFPRRLGDRRLAIGTRGGRVKPSSGYAFARIQADSEAIVGSLLRNNHPFSLPREGPRRRFYDALLLEILANEPAQAKPIFEAMFTRNSIHRIFRFLDESSSLAEDIRLIASLPSAPFLRALKRYLLRKVRSNLSLGRKVNSKG